MKVIGFCLFLDWFEQSATIQARPSEILEIQWALQLIVACIACGRELPKVFYAVVGL